MEALAFNVIYYFCVFVGLNMDAKDYRSRQPP